MIDSPGAELSANVRAAMEARLGHNFADVRVHTDEQAARSAALLSASAYAVGPHVVFGAGRYAPTTPAGTQLLAHELVHVAQQGAQARVADEALTVGVSDAPEEREAEACAAGALSTIVPTSGPQLIRRQAAQPSPSLVRRDDQLRDMAWFPERAHLAWPRLSEGERLAVGIQMARRYGDDFARAFFGYARRRPPVKPTAYYTNVPEPMHRQLRARGYRFATVWMGTEIWVHPSGDSQQRILPAPSRQPASDPRVPSSSSGPPTTLPPPSSWGGLRARRLRGKTGTAERYWDGTIVLNPDDGGVPSFYRPKPDSFNAYYVYDEHGELVEDVIVAIDADAMFRP